MRESFAITDVAALATLPLSHTRAGQRVRIQCLPEHPELCRRLQAMGISIGTELEVIRRGKPGGLLHLANGVLEFMLRSDLAHQMEVLLLEPQHLQVA